MAFHEHYRLPYQAHSAQNRPNFPHIEPPCVAFSPYFPPERCLPLYGHKRTRSVYFSPLHFAPSSADDLMKTVDFRHVDYAPVRRSSFDLSDIFEEDEVDIDVAEILPPSPSATHHSSTFSAKSTRTLSKIGRKVRDVFTLVKSTTFISCMQPRRRQAGPSPVVNDGTKTGLDLLA
ncbi:hypothetical protein BC835DRAFT_1418540 [Cytidiella melzeri]|nr:hypothetical protein BC835DRAFT_1418540 [Cytidiella melzeri]